MVRDRKPKSVPSKNDFIIYYVYGASGPSLLIESTNSMIQYMILNVVYISSVRV